MSRRGSGTFQRFTKSQEESLILCPQALTRALDAARPRIALCMTAFEGQRGGKRPFFKARTVCRGPSLPRLHGEPQIRRVRATRVDDV
jgi:hypothetical protein